MKPEAIRRILEQHREGELVEKAIFEAIYQLALLPARAARLESPFALSKLTMGLEHKDALIDIAVKMQAELKAEREEHRKKQSGGWLHWKTKPEPF